LLKDQARALPPDQWACWREQERQPRRAKVVEPRAGAIFSAGGVTAIGAIINRINVQNLQQLQMDEYSAEIEEDLAA